MIGPDQYLLIPGLSGCKLLTNGQDLGWPGALAVQSWIVGEDVLRTIAAALHLSADELVQLLSMEYADAASLDATKTTLKNGGSVAAGAVLHLAYTQFTDYLPFIYDWRADLRAPAAALLRFLRDNQPTGGRWRILAHSLGGLLLTVASKLCGAAALGGPAETAFSQLVKSVAFLAVPFSGTCRAADAFLRGTDLSPGFAASMRRIVRTWPSLYQLLPAWPGSVETDGVAAPFSALDDRAWTGQSLDPALLARARETRRLYLDAPFRWMSGIKVRLLFSTAHRTWNTVQPGVQCVGRADGDTLVPFDVTYDRLGDSGRQATHAIGGGGNTATHSFLADDPLFATEIRTFLAS